MERGVERSPPVEDYSPVSSPPLRDKRNRPFKALTPKRLGPDPLAGSPPKLTSPKNTSPSLHGKSTQRVIPSIRKTGVTLSKEKLLGVHDRVSSNGEEDEANQEDAHEPKRKTRSQLCAFIQKNEFGSDLVYRGPYGSNVVTYLDYTASGRPLKCIEAYIQRYVLPTYSNTHTEVSYNAIQTTIFREEARDIIRKSVNAGEDDCIIFTGSGVTGAINKLVHCLGLEEIGNVIVFIGPYEHHSNILPWIHSAAQVIRIPQDKDGLVDIKALAYKLEEVLKKSKKSGKPEPFIVGAFSAASNVTGVLTNTYPISCLIHRYNGIVLWDYACAGPYVNVDMNPAKLDPDSDDEPYNDAIFISPHKFIGGPGTPGILIAKKWLFQNQVPHDVGGGTVLFVRRTKHTFISNPEQREEGGTPAIVESIRCGLVFKLKDAVGAKYIMKKEQSIFRKASSYLQDVDGLILLGNPNVHRLPILSFLFYNNHTGRFLHHDYVATIFNEVFGMQVRSGCACAGPYGMDLMGMSEEQAENFEKLITVAQRDESKKPSSHFLDRENIVFQNAIFKPGFVRLNLPFFMTDACMEFALKAIRLVALHGWSLLPQYRCDVDKGGWTHIGAQATYTRRHLDEVSFASGSMTVKKPVAMGVGCNDYCSGCSSDSSSSGSSEPREVPQVNYTSILKRAEGLFYDAMSGLYDTTEDNTAGISDDLMWFVTPKEAADIIHKRKTRSKVKPENLPFMPGGLAVKLGIDPVGHPARGKEMDRKFTVEYYPREHHHNSHSRSQQVVVIEGAADKENASSRRGNNAAYSAESSTSKHSCCSSRQHSGGENNKHHTTTHGGSRTPISGDGGRHTKGGSSSRRSSGENGFSSGFH